MNPYQAPEEPPVRAEVADRPKRQSPPLGYMFIAAVLLLYSVNAAWLVIPFAKTTEHVLIGVGTSAACFVFFALAFIPVWRWFSTGRYR